MNYEKKAIRICAISPRWFDHRFQQSSTTNFDLERAVDFIDKIESEDEITFDFIVYASPSSDLPVTLPVFNRQVYLHQLEPPRVVAQGVLRALLRRLLMQDTTFFAFLYHMTPGFLRQVRTYIDAADIVYLGGAFSTLLVLYAKLKGKVVVNDPYGISSVAAWRAFWETRGLLWRALNLLRTFVWVSNEWLFLALSDRVLMVSERDRQLLIQRFRLSPHRIATLPIPIHIGAYRVISPEEKCQVRCELYIPDGTYVAAFVGHLDSNQNLHAVEYIRKTLLPAMLERGISVHFLLVGGGDPSHPLLQPGENLIFTGHSNQPSRYIGAADICLSPHTIGTGVKQKVLSYMACGRPVLATPQGCFGIDAIPGYHLAVAEIRDYPSALAQLLQDACLRERLGREGRRLVLAKYAYTKVNELRNQILRGWGLLR